MATAPTCTAFFATSVVKEPDTRLPSNVSIRNCRVLSIAATLSHSILKSASE